MNKQLNIDSLYRHINKSGSYIYYLFDDNRIVYIGQSKDNLYGRIGKHNKTKTFSSWSCIECDVSKLNEVEAEQILIHKPIYNKTVPTNKKWISKNQAKYSLGINKNYFNKLLSSNLFSVVYDFGDSYVSIDELIAICGGSNE